MAELDFERSLERLFADAPYFPDGEAFAQRVENRLDRGWAMRGWLIGSAGVVGGVVGVSQLVMSNVVHRVETVSAGSSRVIQAGIAQVKPSIDLLSLVQSDWAVVWVASALAVVAMGFVLTRVIEEI
ncbi:hypothetical protein [Phenylobacterium aquaticum]|uniref:hypothetical protein n=1 Tax=Phenylobacterium aquaticum TaxID=1763816 RepID=UPI0026F35AA2|nr:hypothetical protein [Phenylobacterium aquaticum]